MSFPSDLKYTKDHEWVRLNKDGTATVGITDYALEQLGDVVFLELPKAGDSFDAGTPFGTIESTKTVSDLYSPVGGKIIEVNSAFKDEAYETLTDDPYGKGWLVKFKVAGEGSDLMDEADYEAFIAEED